MNKGIIISGFLLIGIIGCSTDTEKDKRIKDINSTLEKQLEIIDFDEQCKLYYLENILEFEKDSPFAKSVELILAEKMKINNTYKSFYDFISEIKNNQINRSNNNINQLNDEISNKVNNLLDTLFTAVNEDNYSYRYYKLNQKYFDEVDSIYRVKKDYIIKNNHAENTLYLTKVCSDLLLLKMRYSNLTDLSFYEEYFYKPPPEILIFDNAETLKSGDKYYANIIWASNFLKGLGERLGKVIINEIEINNNKDKVYFECPLENYSFKFDYVPEKPGVYTYYGYIEIKQYDNNIWKLPFKKNFEIDDK